MRKLFVPCWRGFFIKLLDVLVYVLWELQVAIDVARPRVGISIYLSLL